MHERFLHETNDQSPSLDSLIRMAERELGAFFAAVTELFGPEQATLSVEDWLEELQSLHTLPGLRNCDWREVTVAALTRLATRVNSPARRSSCSPRDP
jgi:hypothetical protein